MKLPPLHGLCCMETGTKVGTKVTPSQHIMAREGLDDGEMLNVGWIRCKGDFFDEDDFRFLKDTMRREAASEMNGPTDTVYRPGPVCRKNAWCRGPYADHVDFRRSSREDSGLLSDEEMPHPGFEGGATAIPGTRVNLWLGVHRGYLGADEALGMTLSRPNTGSEPQAAKDAIVRSRANWTPDQEPPSLSTSSVRIGPHRCRGASQERVPAPLHLSVEPVHGDADDVYTDTLSDTLDEHYLLLCQREETPFGSEDCSQCNLEDISVSEEPSFWQDYDEVFPGEQFAVVVCKATLGSRLGLDVRETVGRLEVQSISPEGLIAGYNQANPCKPVRVTDQLDNINGVAGVSAVKDLQGWEVGQTLTLLFVRGDCRNRYISQAAACWNAGRTSSAESGEQQWEEAGHEAAGGFGARVPPVSDQADWF